MLRLVAVMTQESELLPGCRPVCPVHAKGSPLFSGLLDQHILFCSMRGKAFSGRDRKMSIVGGAQSSSSARPKFLTFAQSWSSALRRPAKPITSGFTFHLQRNHHAIYSFCHV